MTMTLEQERFKEVMDHMRERCLEIEKDVRFVAPAVSMLPAHPDLGEVKANLMLAVRHIEDARMRLGKAIQYGCQGGVSCFDKPKGGA